MPIVSKTTETNSPAGERSVNQAPGQVSPFAHTTRQSLEKDVIAKEKMGLALQIVNS